MFGMLGLCELSERHRLARGVTWIAGLGLGCIVRMVAEKKNVSRIVLVERCSTLVEWILPRLNIQKPIDIIIGDARDIVPTSTGDVALIDIFESWGGNRFPSCPGFKKVWVWGA
jgi:spermidine synthase